MAQTRRERKEKVQKIKLAHPDRSDPSEATLLDTAEKRGLLKIPPAEGSTEESEDEVLVGRLGEAVLWSISLTMLHFTLDVLVTHQYAIALSWPTLIGRALRAFPVILLLFYTLHPHAQASSLFPPLPARIQPILHQLFFFGVSLSAGSYLIYITNMHGHYAVMKRAPPLGCLWIWSVIELDLVWAASSLLGCVGFLKWNGYSYL